MTSKMLVSRWQCPDGTILESKHRHDYASHEDTKTGEHCFIDGGCDYVRSSGNLVDLSIYSDDSHDVIRLYFTWGTYGINGDEPKRYVPLKDLTEDHIRAILRTQVHIQGTTTERVLRNELAYRKGAI
jgi:hypothetical protein